MSLCVHVSSHAGCNGSPCSAEAEAVEGSTSFFLDRQFCGSAPLGVGHFSACPGVPYNVSPAAVTLLKNLGPSDCSETVQRQTSRTHGHFAILAH